MTTWVGASITRLEDEHFLTGDTRFVDDLSRPGLLHVAMVRSPVASAAFDEVDTSDARTAPWRRRGADRRGPRPHQRPTSGTPPSPVRSHRDAVAGHRTGSGMSASRWHSCWRRPASAAEDAADLVWVDYEERSAVSTIDGALTDGAEPVHADAPGNVLLDLPMFQDPALEDVLARAAVVVEGVFDAGRVTAAPMEGRGVVGGMGSARGAADRAHVHPGASHRAHRYCRHAWSGRASGPSGRSRRRWRLWAEMRRGSRGTGRGGSRRAHPPAGEVGGGPAGEPAVRLPGSRAASPRPGRLRQRLAPCLGLPPTSCAMSGPTTATRSPAESSRSWQPPRCPGPTGCSTTAHAPGR